MTKQNKQNNKETGKSARKDSIISLADFFF